MNEISCHPVYAREYLLNMLFLFQFECTRRSFLLILSSSSLMLIPEAALDKKEYKKIACPVQGKKLHYHTQSKEVVMVCSDCSIAKVSLDGDKFSADMIK
jgi:hypothetical protein